jgi:hypothetical protein
MIFSWFKKLEKKQGAGNPLSNKDHQDSNIKKTKPLINTTILNTKNTGEAREKSKLRFGTLGAALLKYRMISNDNLKKALDIQEKYKGTKKKLLGEILLENKFLTEEQLISIFAIQCRIPYIKINKYGLSNEAINSVPAELVIKHKMLPTDKIGSVLILAVVDPYNKAGVQEIEDKTKLKIKTVLCKQSEFNEIVKFYYPHLKDE